MAVACRTVKEDEAHKKPAKKMVGAKTAGAQTGEARQGLFTRLTKVVSFISLGSLDDHVQNTRDDLVGVGDHFDEGAGTCTSELTPVDMSDETLAWPRFVPVIRLIRHRAR